MTTATAAIPKEDQGTGAAAVRRMLSRLGIWVVVLLLTMAGVIVFGTSFLNANNLLTIVRSITIMGIVAIGVAFITYGGHYVDLSIPSMMVCVGFVTTSLLPYGIVASLAGGLAAGALIGCANGSVVGYLRLNPILWTLAMNFLLAGLLRWGFGGSQVYPDTAPGTSGHLFLQLYARELPFGIPLMTVVLAALTAVFAWLMARTRFGRLVQFTGASHEAARLSGVPVRKTVLLTFLLSAGTTSIAAIFLASGSQAATFELGSGYDFAAITAVVLGGVPLSGGKGSILGVLGGVLVIGVLDNLLILAGCDSFDQMIVRGAVFVGVVGASSYLLRKGGRE